VIVTERTRARRRDLVEARARHASARIPPDGRGPKPPIGRRTGLFLVLFLASASLVLLGLVMALSATAAPSLSGTDSAWSLFKSQATWLGVGVLALLVLLRIDYHHWKRLAPVGLGVSVLLLALTAVPSIGLSANGARRWLGVGSIVFQPSELAKIAFVVFIADLLSRPDRPMEDVRSTLQPVLLLTGVMTVLLMLQPHLGTTLVIAGVALTMLYFAGARLSHLVVATVAGAAATAMMVAYSPWRRDRMLGFLDPWEDPFGNGYQTLKSLHAMASGGVAEHPVGQVVHGGHRLLDGDLGQANVLFLLRDRVRVGPGQQLVVSGLRFLQRRLRARQRQFGFEDVIVGWRLQ